jgi:hypothetical protein
MTGMTYIHVTYKDGVVPSRCALPATIGRHVYDIVFLSHEIRLFGAASSFAIIVLHIQSCTSQSFLPHTALLMVKTGRHLFGRNFPN